jgi:hypothetical protein
VNPHTGKRRIDEAFPKELRETTLNNEMFIRFKNGSTWQAIGSDNYNSLVGSPPIGVVFSEWALARPEAWSYIRPILAENGGWALFIWTPRGRNHATQAFESRSLDKVNWFTLKSPVSKTNVFTNEQLKREFDELVAESGSIDEGKAKYEQEYEVNFDSSAPGAYYANLINDAEREGRVTSVPYDKSLQVFTSWDLGIDDYTAIWFWQQVGREVRAIDYYETSGEGLQSIVTTALMSKPYVYGGHHLPHDVEVRELGAGGKSRRQTLTGLGLSNIKVGVAQGPDERINAMRQMLPITWFDAEKCAFGLNRLRAYRKKWNKTTSSYSGPLHDESSHGADAAGEFAVNRRGVVVRKTKEPGDFRERSSGPVSWMGV